MSRRLADVPAPSLARFDFRGPDGPSVRAPLRARFSASPVLRVGGPMKHSFAYLMLAGLTIAAGSNVVMSAAQVRHPVGYIEILVDGVAQRRYAHEGRSYVEARKGKEYAIRLRNPYPVRVAVALSVDGLNTIDARQTTAAARASGSSSPTGPSPSAGGRRARRKLAASNSPPRSARTVTRSVRRPTWA